MRSIPSILPFLSILLPATTHATIIYNDGQTHSLTNFLTEDTINLRSSSKLTISSPQTNGDTEKYVIRSPPGSEYAIRLYMSSYLNVTGGEIVGGDAAKGGDSGSETSTVAGAGIIVGSGSRADFYAGATVRGGSHLGGVSPSINNVYPMEKDDEHEQHESVTKTQRSLHEINNPKLVGTGGDAIQVQYFESSVTIQGGTFIGGKGVTSDGHSVHVTYDAIANIHGGNYQGSWLARDRGVINVFSGKGCLSRVGNRLVGSLEDGSDIDVEFLERDEGKIVLVEVESDSCSSGKRHSWHNSAGGVIMPNFGAVVSLLALGLWSVSSLI